MAEFSPVKWSKCLGCHMVVMKGRHINVNLRKFAMLYSAVVVMMGDNSHASVTMHQGTLE